LAAPAEGDKKKRDKPYLSTKKEKVIPMKVSQVTAADKANKLRKKSDHVPQAVVSVARSGSRSTNMVAFSSETIASLRSEHATVVLQLMVSLLCAFGQMPLAQDTRLRSTIASASSSGASVVPCEDCYLPSEQQAYLCDRCYESRSNCRTCQNRRERD
jgi:ubiquitin